ncbi:MAG TPA: hypothetical protein VNK05_11190 [Chloroflexota bacterium]|nr:hypothetical protein [Chloroflexota bacterium]
MSGNPSGEVERLESWQLPAYLSALRSQGVAEVTWNRETIGLDVAGERAARVSPTATVVVDGATIYVAEPDHSADEAPPPGVVPIQIGPRRGVR